MVARHPSPAFRDRIIGNAAPRPSRSRAPAKHRGKFEPVFAVALTVADRSRHVGVPLPATLCAELHTAGVAFGDTRGTGAYADARTELDGDTRSRVYLLQVINQLGQVFDAVDIVMWRRRDQRHVR